ncbi:CHAD domain-containing protein [Tepidiforma sp.]|uniref:CYTH and CHAD domain-containing protein n=1 Tax=Tepidiforma sp. TaxID=2682230 RepID=UPI002639B37E|nr:CHAD domain-containing protein [Tepidiforma sp.]MCX7618233.1 CHAD domain-containing protein [Tepidiforma sp.]
MTSPALEVEWQFAALDTRPVGRWLQSSAPPGYAVEPLATQSLDDTYLDTPDWRIHRAGYTCRVRAKADGAELTLKSMAEPQEGIRSRREITAPLPGPEADPRAAPGEAGAALRALCGREPLEPLFRLLTTRQRFRLADGEGPLGEIALDDTAIPVAGDEPVRLARVEVEVDAAALDRARPFVDALADACSLGPAGTSKFEAALIATGRRPPEPPSFGPEAVDPAMTAGQVAYAVLRKQFRVFLLNEPGTRLGEDIEALHDMRVATRRLRAAMATFRPFLTPRMLAFRDEFGLVARALGEVRDLDVQLERMDEWRAEFPPERAHLLDGIERLLRKRREAARRRMLQVLDSRRYERLCARFATALRSGPPRSFAPGRTPVLAVAPDLVERRYRKVRKLGDRIKKSSPPEAYHLLRIEAKKLRYALEFVGNGIYGKPALEFSARVTALQDLLGLHQDAYVAIDMLEELAASSGRRLEPATLMAMGMLAERYRAHAEELRAKFPQVYRQLAGPEWKKLLRLMEAQRPLEPAPARARAAGDRS